mgnify:CR=1 FL=1
MKKIVVFLMVCLAFSRLNAQQNKISDRYRSAQKMLQARDYFKAEDYVYQNDKYFSRFESLVLQANLDNIFNSPALSNEKIATLFNEFGKGMGDSLRLGLLRLRHANHARLFEYADALKTANQILSGRSKFLTKEEADDFRNMANIWILLQKQPKQEVVINQATVVKMSRDKANLANLPVKKGAVIIDFIFDTGANLSTIIESTAAKMGMNQLGGSIEVGSITGAKVKAKMALCPEFSIGNIVVKNAVFLVFPDEALAFPQIDYQINGIIGFPVIEAMGEIQINKADDFIVPNTATPISGQEMALDFLIPVIRIGDEHYTFDTGAVGTTLYPKYFEKHKPEIIATYKESDIEFGGAGGMTTKKGYVITFAPLINAKIHSLENVQLLIQQSGDEEKFFYGNIGQDLIKQFEKMTISFRGMFIRFD